LQNGIERKGWSTITEAAEKIGIERTFLSRLLKGEPPRWRRGGSRSKVEPDERYQRMARKLDLGEEFLEAVARELKARSPKGRKAPESQRAKTAVPQAIFDDDLGRRYPDLWRLVEAHGELRGESALLRLAEDCLTGIQGADAWKRRLRSYRHREHFFEAKRHDRLGTFQRLSRQATSVESRTCRRIAEAITDDIGPKADESSLAERIEIASFFFELAYARFE
jgi:hypothetical protein